MAKAVARAIARWRAGRRRGGRSPGSSADRRRGMPGPPGGPPDMPEPSCPGRDRRAGCFAVLRGVIGWFLRIRWPAPEARLVRLTRNTVRSPHRRRTPGRSARVSGAEAWACGPYGRVRHTRSGEHAS
ncbi:hypothetical protein TPA0909_13330 [Streptomyces albus]|nr:hypothetical protein TPA0909_13330 [Streptomyces albus]